eukprot:TRINITY_DN2536_c0_g1_i11.p1 TRINITY_DN2536_c0_g1~~TRINITY_DN2536_c0_g1_i11.p1  ORF type:complete len:284 (-),score=101.84 TRINITY_DN2536_c0_g1_i11:448-1299(-)
MANLEHDSESIFEVFAEYGDHLAQEMAAKEKVMESVKGVEKESRKLYTILQNIHRPGAKINEIVLKAEETFEGIHIALFYLDQVIPKGCFWRYCNLWSNTLSWLSFLASLVLYLKEDTLPEKPKVSALLGLTSDLHCLHLDIEEYLQGLCHLCNELPRLAVNSVTNQDYNRPVRISQFLGSLYSGFRLLNLKNDNLRKRFDSIKYDQKKVEEVVYDLSIRGLLTINTTKEAANAASKEDEKDPKKEEDGKEKAVGETSEKEENKKDVVADEGIDEVDPEKKTT